MYVYQSLKGHLPLDGRQALNALNVPEAARPLALRFCVWGLGFRVINVYIYTHIYVYM